MLRCGLGGRTVERSSKVEPWVTFLEWDVLGKESEGGYRVYEVVIKVQGSGLLAVVKARDAQEHVVSFVGARSLSSLARGIRGRLEEEGKMWRLDKFVQT